MSPLTKQSAALHSNLADTCEELARGLKKVEEKQRHEQKQVRLLLLVRPSKNIKAFFAFESTFALAISTSIKLKSCRQIRNQYFNVLQMIETQREFCLFYVKLQENDAIVKKISRSVYTASIAFLQT